MSPRTLHRLGCDLTVRPRNAGAILAILIDHFLVDLLLIVYLTISRKVDDLFTVVGAEFQIRGQDVEAIGGVDYGQKGVVAHRAAG